MLEFPSSRFLLLMLSLLFPQQNTSRDEEVAIKYLRLVLSCYMGYTGGITVSPNLRTEVLPAFVCQELGMLDKH